MHDANGTPLKQGDKVLIPATKTAQSPLVEEAGNGDLLIRIPVELAMWATIRARDTPAAGLREEPA